MNSKNLVITSLLGFLVLGCEQNPYPKSGRFFLSEPQKTTPPTADSIEAPSSADCVENESCSISIRGSLANKGTPELTFAVIYPDERAKVPGLPTGAVYDPQKEELQYTPPYEAIDIARDPAHPVKTLGLEVTLYEKGDFTTRYKTKVIPLSIRNVNRPLDIQTTNSTLQIREGSRFETKLKIVSPDFPAGPFSLAIIDSPNGMSAKQTSGSEFELTYLPPANTVTVSDPIDPATGERAKKLSTRFLVVFPSGETQTLDPTIVVIDERLAPLVSAPSAISQGPEINFTIRVDDLNGERLPVVNLPAQMPFGQLDITELPLPSIGNWARMYNIRWSNIPRSHRGETVNFDFIVCGASSETADTFCRPHNVQITIL